MGESLSRRLARFAAHLHYDELPPEVVDKAKACLLHNLATCMLGWQGRSAQVSRQVALAAERPARAADGATILAEGSRVARMAAAFVNAAQNAGYDSYRMVTHPGQAVVPAGLATAEGRRVRGNQLLCALVAAYEVQCRIAGDFLPSMLGVGFRPSPVCAIFGATVATGRLLGLDEDQLTAAIGLAVTYACGTAEAGRTGGSEGATGYQDCVPVRNGMLAALLAREGGRYSETALEGDGGFYYTFAGSNTGRLSYVFTGPKQIDMESVVRDLGGRYTMLDVTFKVYVSGGYNQAIIDLACDLRRRHDLDPQQIDRVELEQNYLETVRPSPSFPAPAPPTPKQTPRFGSTPHCLATALVTGTFPMFGLGRTIGVAPSLPIVGEAQDSAIVELSRKIVVKPSRTRTYFAPRIAILLSNGHRVAGEYHGRELTWDFATDRERLQACVPMMPVSASRFEELADTVATAERLRNIDRLITLTLAEERGGAPA